MNAKTYETPVGTIAYWTDDTAGASAPWLILLPGLTADHRLFDKQVEDLSGTFNLLVWDPPAHGQSRPMRLTFTLDDWARWLHRILEAENITNFVLVGQSMGGYLSQAFINMYPREAKAFVSIDSAPLKRSYFRGWELWALKHTKLMYLCIPWKLLMKWGANGVATTAYGKELMAKMMSGFGKVEYCSLAAHGYRMLAEAAEAEDHAYELDCPTLLLCGDHDAAGSAKRYNVEWNRQEDFPLIFIEDAGHNANTDRPDLVNPAIKAFVEKALQ